MPADPTLKRACSVPAACLQRVYSYSAPAACQHRASSVPTATACFQRAFSVLSACLRVSTALRCVLTRTKRALCSQPTCHLFSWAVATAACLQCTAEPTGFLAPLLAAGSFRLKCRLTIATDCIRGFMRAFVCALEPRIESVSADARLCLWESIRERDSSVGRGELGGRGGLRMHPGMRV